MQERTQYRPTTDSAVMKWIVRRAAWLIPRSKAAMCSPRSMEPWVDRIVESCWSLAKPCSHAHLPEFEKDLEIPHHCGQTGGNPPCGWATATSQTNTLSEQTTELCMLEVYDDSPSTAGQKRTFDQSSRLHKSRGRQQQMTQLIVEHYQKYMNTTTRTRKRTRTTMRTRSHHTSQKTTMTCNGRCFRSLTTQSSRGELH